MKIKSAELEVSATDLVSCPRRVVPEFAFIGRSNVGKSSLINLLTQRRALARVSGTPGKTQLINFFLINDAWRLVDLPGYGYAKVAKTKRFNFSEATAEYLAGREHLTCTFVLIDSRLEPQAVDLDFLQWIEPTHSPYALVFTKADKQSAAQGETNVARFMARVAEWRKEAPRTFLTSAETGAGRNEILAFIDQSLSKPARSRRTSG